MINLFSYQHITKRLKAPEMTPKWRIHHAHTWHNEHIQRQYMKDPDEHTWALAPVADQKKRARRWRSTDARLKTTWERSCKGTLTLTQKPQTPWNKQSDTVTVGTTMDPHTRDPWCSQERATAYTLHRGVSPFPAPPLYSFHLHSLSTGAFVQAEVQILETH